MSTRPRRVLTSGIAVASTLAVAIPVVADTTPQQDLQHAVEKLAPPNYTLPGKVLCACPQQGIASNAVGYLNSFVDDHGGSFKTVDVWCVFNGYLANGLPAFTTACGDYRLPKK